MKCPVDETVLQMTERRGVEIDYCPQCRGVWLGRGELDKIIEADLASSSPPRSAPAAPAAEARRGDYRDDYRDDHRERDRHDRKPKKKNLLGELFDF
jgi:Zn-finger nucleic acid-binding protein